MAAGRAAEPPEPALPPGPDAPAPELQGGADGVLGVPPPWLEPEAATGAVRAVAPAKASWVPERISADDIHAGLLSALGAVAGAASALALGWAAKLVMGAASGGANVAAAAAWRWSSDDHAATGASTQNSEPNSWDPQLRATTA